MLSACVDCVRTRQTREGEDIDVHEHMCVRALVSVQVFGARRARAQRGGDARESERAARGARRAQLEVCLVLGRRS